MEGLKQPPCLSFKGNLCQNWEKWIQRFNIYLVASGADKKPPEVQVAIFLHVIGKRALEKYNAFELSDSDKKDVNKVIEASDRYCTLQSNESVHGQTSTTTTQQADDGGGFGKSRFDQPSGGFLNTSVAASPSGAEKKKAGRLSNVVPCTIAQIHLMPESDENLKIGSLSANIVIVVGLVQSVDVQATKITYVIDDCTGPGIEVQMWIGESDEQNKKINIIQENTYARVTGAIRSMKGKRHILAFNIQAVKEFNEITMHIAEVMHTSMAVAVMDKQGSSGGGFNTTSLMTPGMTTSSTDTFSSNDSRKLTRPQQLVKQAIISCKNEEGINVIELYNSLKSINRQAIQEALEFLCNEGHIYSTIDEDHYKSTDCV